MTNDSQKTTRLKEKLIREFKEMLIIFLYLALFFCAFTTYRRLTLKEVGAAFPHYGLALIKALVLAKVILLGRYTRLEKILDDWPLIVPTLYKVFVFSLFALAFEILEHAIGSSLHGKGFMGGFEEIIGLGRNELLARTLVVLCAFIPFFAFTEAARVFGEGKLSELFFHGRTAKDSGK